MKPLKMSQNHLKQPTFIMKPCETTYYFLKSADTSQKKRYQSTLSHVPPVRPNLLLKFENLDCLPTVSPNLIPKRKCALSLIKSDIVNN